MRPNFSECQLQHLVNSEITVRLLSEGRGFIPAILPSARLEKKLGWDTGFYFPWWAIPPKLDHKGCNFFIQYKISELLGSNGKEWGFWNNPYYRFKIPYDIKTDEGEYEKDFEQYDCLKNLSNKGYSVVYITNNVMKDKELFKLAEQRQLLETFPYLDVAEVRNRHVTVTFSNDKDIFLLHSEPEDVKKKHSKELMEELKNKEATELQNDIKIFEKIVIEFEEKNDINSDYRYKNKINRIEKVNDEEMLLIKISLINKAYKKYFDLTWYNIFKIK